MRPRLLPLLSLALLVPLGGRAEPAAPDGDLVVTPAWLASHLADPALVLLHVGDRADYDEGHIPGARFVSTSDLAVSDRTGAGLILEMPPAEELRRRLEALGISDGSRVVVVFGRDWVSPATRILFTLDYAGLGARSSLLDGGMQAWMADGRPVTPTPPAATAGKLSPLKPLPTVVDADFVRSHLGRPGYSVVDARTSAFYGGAETGGTPDGPHCTGHVGGAVSIPYLEVFDDGNRLRPKAELRALFAKAGVKPGDTVIGYCHIGQQATAMLLAARALGHPVLLYDGSFQDWSRRPGLPVENPAKR